MYDASEFERMSKQPLAKAAGIVAFLTIVSKILGFIRETSLAAVFGATADVDAYLVAQTIPLFLFSIVSYSLTTTFIPMYSRVREEHGRDHAVRFTSTVMWAILVVGIVLVIVGEIFAAPLVRIVAPGFEGEIVELTVYMSRIIFPMMVFQLLSGIMTGILQAHNNFATPTAAGLFQNIGIIVAIWAFGSNFGIVSVSVGLLVGTILSTLVKIPAVYRTGFRWGRTFNLRDVNLKRMLVLMVPAVIGAGAGSLNTLVDRILASGLPEGRISALNYANRLMDLAPSIIGTSILTVVYPTLAKMAARKEWRGFGEGLASYLGLIHLLLAPIAVGVLVLREPLVRVVFERGIFDDIATKETAWALLFLSLGIAISSMRMLVNRAFFAMHDTKTPMVLGLITVGINIVLNIVLIGPLEQGGLALATTLAATVGLLVGLLFFRKKAPVQFPGRRLASSVFRTGIASALMGVALWFIYPWIERGLAVPGTLAELARLGLAAVVGAGIYVFLIWALRVPETSEIIRVFQRILARIRVQTAKL